MGKEIGIHSCVAGNPEAEKELERLREIEENWDRGKILLKAMCEMLDKQNDSHYVESIFETTAIWDDAECDGYCWHEEAKDLIENLF